MGFGGTGKLWYFQHLDIIPDIVVFGKKTQLSGIMAIEKLGDIFKPEKSVRLEVTWDGDVSDMVRCKYIMKAYQENNILKNVADRSVELIDALTVMPQIENLRNCGLMVGFDLSNTKKRDILLSKLYKSGLVCNKTGNRSIRLRPNLNITEHEIQHAIEIFYNALK